jgi:hypothetical protein
MELDIRKTTKEQIEIIRVWDKDDGFYAADIISKDKYHEKVIMLRDSDDDYEPDNARVHVMSKEHALHLIDGIQKAIDLGWFE